MCYVVFDLQACQFGNIPQKKSGSLAQARSIIHRNVSTPNLGEDCLYLEQFNNRWNLHEVLFKDIKSIVIWVASQPLFGVVLGVSLAIWICFSTLVLQHQDSLVHMLLVSRSLLPLVFCSPFGFVVASLLFFGP